jgi:hypothetical protein
MSVSTSPASRGRLPLYVGDPFNFALRPRITPLASHARALRCVTGSVRARTGRATIKVATAPA